MIPLWKILDAIDQFEDFMRRACFLTGLAPRIVGSKPLPGTEIVILKGTDKNAEAVNTAVR